VSFDDRARAEIEAQIGRSAGHICFTNFRHESYLTGCLDRAAQAVWESLRSTWTLVDIWNNGSTIWQSTNRDELALVTPEGDIDLQPGNF
jgi:hypothetical protein